MIVCPEICHSDSCHAREPKRSRGRSEGAKSDGTRGRVEVSLGRGAGGQQGRGAGEGEQIHEKGGVQERRRRQMRRAQSEAATIHKKVLKLNQNFGVVA